MATEEINALLAVETPAASMKVVLTNNPDGTTPGGSTISLTTLVNTVAAAASSEGTPTAEAKVLVYDSGAVVLVPPGDLPQTGAPVDLYSYSPGTFTAGQLLLSIDCLRAIAFPADLAGSTLLFDAAATATSTLTISNAGSIVGQGVVVAGSSSATIALGAFSTAAHNRFEIVAPTPADATLAGARCAVTGTR